MSATEPDNSFRPPRPEFCTACGDYHVIGSNTACPTMSHSTEVTMPKETTPDGAERGEGRADDPLIDANVWGHVEEMTDESLADHLEQRAGMLDERRPGPQLLEEAARRLRRQPTDGAGDKAVEACWRAAESIETAAPDLADGLREAVRRLREAPPEGELVAYRWRFQHDGDDAWRYRSYYPEVPNTEVQPVYARPPDFADRPPTPDPPEGGEGPDLDALAPKCPFCRKPLTGASPPVEEDKRVGPPIILDERDLERIEEAVDDRYGTQLGSFYAAVIRRMVRDFESLPEEEEERGESLRDRIEDALLRYRCAHTEHGELGEGLPLVDALTPPKESSIRLGRVEVGVLADYLEASLAAPDARQEEGDGEDRVHVEEATTDEALQAVLAERVRQDERWGDVEDRTHLSLGDLLAILTEEVGELAEAVLEFRYGDDQSSNIGLDMRDEAVQIAAVGLFIVEWLDLSRLRAPQGKGESDDG